MGPFLFCVVLQPILVELNDLLRQLGSDGEALAFLDDITILVEEHHIMNLFLFLIPRAKSVGLELNMTKCGVYDPAGILVPNMSLTERDVILPPGIIIHEHGMSMLGAPIGSDDFCALFWGDYVNTIEKETIIITGWDNVQYALLLFRLCISSKLNFMLRSVPPSANFAPMLVNRASVIMKSGLARLLQGQDHISPDLLDDFECVWWQQASLPPSMGGIGIINPSIIHNAAYLASEAAVASSLTRLNRKSGAADFIPSNTAIECYAKCVIATGDLLSADLDIDAMYRDPLKLQHKICGAIYETLSQKLRVDLQTAHRLDSCSGEGAVLITTMPKDHTDSIMNSACMRERLCMRLGVAIPYICPGPCKCNTPFSNQHVDSTGYHLLSGCTAGSERDTTHNTLRDTVIEMLRQANMTCRPEGREIILADDPTSKKRMDIMVDNFQGPMQLGIDTSLIDPRNAAFQNLRNPMKAGNAALQRENYKTGKYGEIYLRENCLLRPFVVEAFGRFGDGTRKLFNQLVARVHAAKNHLSLSHLKTYWRSRIVMAVHIAASDGVLKRYNDVLRRRGGLSALYENSPPACEVVDYEGYDRCRY